MENILAKLKIIGDLKVLTQASKTSGVLQRHLDAMNRSGLSKVSTHAKNLNHDLSVTNQKLGRTRALTMGVNSSFSQMERRARSMAASMGLLVGAASAVRGVSNIITTGANFEKKVSTVRALSGADEQETAALRASAKRAGASSVFKASQAAQAQAFLAQAGQKPTEILQTLDPTLNLAAAGDIDLAKAADISTNVLAQFGKSAAQTSEVVDKMSFVQSSANTDIIQMAEALNYLGPTAKSMNIDLSETLSVIGTMANAGLKGSLATRALGTSLVRLSKPTKEMQRAMSALNLTLFEDGKFVGIIDMIEQLEQSMEGLSQQHRSGLLSSLFGAESFQEINILLEQGSEALKKYYGDIEQSSGAAQQMAATRLENLSGDWVKLTSVAESRKLDIFKELSPMLRTATQLATMWVKSMDTAPIARALKNTFFLVVKLVRILKKWWGVIKFLVKAYLALRISMMLFNGLLKVQAFAAGLAALRIRTMGSATRATTIATRAAAVATTGLNNALKLNPITGVISLVLGLATAYTTLGSNITKVNEVEEMRRMKNKQLVFEQQSREETVEDVKSLMNYFSSDAFSEKDKKLKAGDLSFVYDKVRGYADEAKRIQAALGELSGGDHYNYSQLSNLIKKHNQLKGPQVDKRLKMTIYPVEEEETVKSALEQYPILKKHGLRGDTSRWSDMLSKIKPILDKYGPKDEDEDPLKDEDDPFKNIGSDVADNIVSGGRRQVTVNILEGGSVLAGTQIINEDTSITTEEMMDEMVKTIMAAANEAGLQSATIMSRN